MKTNKNKCDWVFWVKIHRRNWYRKFDVIRGANFFEIQFLYWYISVGRPWRNCVIERHLLDYGDLKRIENANKANRRIWKKK